MCVHQPPCPPASAPDRDAARVVAAHQEQGWSLLCNGVIAFDDLGDLLPGGGVIPPPRSRPLPTAAGPAPPRPGRVQVRRHPPGPLGSAPPAADRSAGLTAGAPGRWAAAGAASAPARPAGAQAVEGPRVRAHQAVAGRGSPERPRAARAPPRRAPAAPRRAPAAPRQAPAAPRQAPAAPRRGRARARAPVEVRAARRRPGQVRAGAAAAPRRGARPGPLWAAGSAGPSEVTGGPWAAVPPGAPAASSVTRPSAAFVGSTPVFGPFGPFGPFGVSGMSGTSGTWGTSGVPGSEGCSEPPSSPDGSPGVGPAGSVPAGASAGGPTVTPTAMGRAKGKRHPAPSIRAREWKPRRADRRAPAAGARAVRPQRHGQRTGGGCDGTDEADRTA
jgi:hypothetical protein